MKVYFDVKLLFLIKTRGQSDFKQFNTLLIFFSSSSMYLAYSSSQTHFTDCVMGVQGHATQGVLKQRKADNAH